MRLETERFLLRPLRPEDVTERYSRWFDDAVVRQAISAASAPHALEDLRQYVAERIGREDVLFLGIFTREDGEHIGNLKYEPVDLEQGYAVMGILIGEPAWRGRGVAGEVLKASAQWLRDNRGIREVVLGVHKDNPAAIAAYEKVGFRIAATEHIKINADIGISMVWDLSKTV